MTRKSFAKTVSAAGTLLIAIVSSGVVADQGKREEPQEVVSPAVEVTSAAEIATDVTVTEHPGVTQAEPGKSIHEEMRLKPSE